MHTVECGFADGAGHEEGQGTMAIHIFCNNCKTSNGLDADKCSKCGKPFGRSKKYRVSVSNRGRRHTRVVDNLTMAREVEGAIKGDLVRDEYDIADHKAAEKVTLNLFFDNHFLPWAKEHKRTWRNDKYLFDSHLKPRFGGKTLEEISAFEIDRMKLAMKKAKNKQGRPFTPATIKHVVVLLKRLFNLAGRWRIHKGANPCANVELPKLDNKITEYLTEEETERLLKVLDAWPFKQTAAFIRFAMFTGCRRGELFKMKWGDVDVERKLLTLRAPKGGKTETIPLSDAALSAIAELPRKSEYVFPGREGAMLTDFKGPWERVRKEAKLPASFRFHGLRHSFASKLVSSGVDLYTVGRLLTHKQAVTTQRYAHLSDEAMRRAVEKSAEVITPKDKKEEDVELAGNGKMA